MKIEITDFKEIRNFVLIWAGVVLALYLMTYLAIPGYIIPFLNNPIGRLVAILLCVWQLIGSIAFILIPFNMRTWVRVVQKILFILVLVVPNLLAALLGPAIRTTVTPSMINPDLVR